MSIILTLFFLPIILIEKTLTLQHIIPFLRRIIVEIFACFFLRSFDRDNSRYIYIYRAHHPLSDENFSISRI